MKLKLDLHVHTNRSSDAFTSPKLLATICRDRGLDGLAITDHNVLARDLRQFKESGTSTGSRSFRIHTTYSDPAQDLIF